MQDVDGHCHCDPLGNGDSIDHHSLQTVANEAVGRAEEEVISGVAGELFMVLRTSFLLDHTCCFCSEHPLCSGSRQ